MSWVATAVIGGAVVGGVAQSKSASKAAKAQTQAAEAGAEVAAESNELAIAEQRRQFDEMVKLMQPYVQAGNQSVEAQGALLGLNGPEAQAEAIEMIKSSPQFDTMVQTGEEAMLQNAAATGGLRGGNLQEALMRFRPQVLSGLIDQQFQRLGGVSQLGQASAAGQASAGMNTGTNIGSLLSNTGLMRAGALETAGAARAGADLARGSAFAGLGNAATTLGTLKALKAF